MRTAGSSPRREQREAFGGDPEVPTIAEAGVPGYEVVQWFGILAPANTPREIVTRLHTASIRALQIRR